MSIGILFWVLMIVWLVFGLAGHRLGPEYYGWGNSLLIFILLALLGWKVFGPALHS